MPSLPKTCHLARLVVIAAVFLFPLSASAITLTEYQHKLKQSITALDTLVHVDENESEADFKNRLLHTIDAVRTALPEQMTIEENGDVCTIDNTALHKTLEDLKAYSIEDQLKKIDDVKEMLSSVETRVEERIAATPTGETKAQAKLRLESVLARPEYAT